MNKLSSVSTEDSVDTTFQMWLTEPLPTQVRFALERLKQADDVHHVAVMPDVHLSESFCIGTVIATRHLLYPDAVGGDIGCGMAAVKFSCGADVLQEEADAGELLAGLYRAIPGARHRRDSCIDALPSTLLEHRLSFPRLETMKHREGKMQFATLGRGNHFLEFQADAEGALWAMVHSGSRAMGQAIRHHHLERAQRGASGLAFLDARTPEGQDYLNDVQWALRYASASRLAMLDAAGEVVASLFGGNLEIASLVHCNHNHVAQEAHLGESWWIHRKGANAAHAGAPGIIPGSMGSSSFLVEGRGVSASLCSSSHGAGRAMRRKQAFQTFSVRDLERQMKGIWFDRRKSPMLLDEAPKAYKDIRAVMKAQRELVCILRELTPLLSYKVHS